MMVIVESSFSQSSSSSSFSERDLNSTPVISSNQSSPNELTQTLGHLSLQSTPRQKPNESNIINKEERTTNIDDNGNENENEKIENDRVSYRSSINDDGFHRDNSIKSVYDNATVAKFSCPYEEPLIVQYSTSNSSSRKQKNITVSSGNNHVHSVLFPTPTTIMGDQNHSTMIPRIKTETSGAMMFFLICDYFSGIPFTILRQQIGRLFHLDVLFDLPRFLFPRSYSNNTVSAGITKPLRILSKNRRLQHQRQQRRRSAQRRLERPIHILGLPNQGQTCFLNSVLQSLASLEPFLAYLEEIIQFQEEMEQVVASSSLSELDNDNNDKERRINVFTPPSSPSFSKELLDLLKGINYLKGEIDDDLFDDDEIQPSDGDGGVFSTILSKKIGRKRRKNPKGLLRQIAKHNKQFQTYGIEQQDAQELFAALMEVVIHDAELDSSSSSDRRLETYNPNCSIRKRSTERHLKSNHSCSVRTSIGAWNLEDVDDEDRLMTSVFANTISVNRELLSKTTITNGTDLMLVDDDESEFLSLSDLLLRIREEQKKSSSESTDDSSSVISTSKYCRGIQQDQECHQQEQQRQHHFQEEKKQEHNDCPRNTLGVNSMSSSSSCRKEKEHRKSKNSHCNINNGFSLKYKSPQRQSTAKKSMLGVMSSTTPSPFSGWLGSTLRCTKCNHVRPIQNAPFLNIPLVPTSVPIYLSKAYSCGSKPISPHIHPLPSCTLDECLVDFTSVERVQDVECRFCTIQQEINNLEEEATMLQAAVEITEKRINRKNRGQHDNNVNSRVDPTEQTKNLREDLSKVERSLFQLKTMDIDEDDIENSLSSIVNHNDDSFLFGFYQKRSVPIQRCEAKKCLLMTRTPSILCCHIQRRYYDPFTNRMEKCIQSVEFSQFLDLSPYCAYGHRAIIQWAAGSSLNDDEKDRREWSSRNSNGKMPYRLQSVIVHQGNAYGGHYVAYRRNHSGCWFRISDSNVVEVPWRYVQTCQAYMLFYESI
mmetsp:Transcript_4407/g.5000  ORF Transcript_4407/g.5000 Transcript_4407/m.5000 type:complete len:991 (-) Transcript_4407:103-3075(-)